MIRSKFNSSIDDIFEQEDLNPMESVANLSDAMLILAVGIMLSLVMAWNVDIGNKAADVQQLDNAAVIQDDDLVIDKSKDTNEEVGNLGLSEYGTVYVDNDGNLYVLKGDE